MHESHYLLEVLILLSAAVVIVAGFRHLNLSPVLGYLVAGAAIGPYGLGIIADVSTTSSIAEFGVVFLLFMIGLEMTLDRLRAMRKHVFGFGTLQVFLTGLLIAGIAILTGSKVESAIIIGGGLALSSTAVVMQVILERGEQATQVGRLALATLILQDFAVVPLLVLVPLLAAGGGDVMGVILHAGAKAVVAMILIIIVGRLLLRPLFRLISAAQNEDLFSITTLLIVLGASWITENAGLSLALGAFIAGMLVAETEYHHQVAADTMPFKGIFLGLFFMTVGMSVNLQLVLEHFFQLVLMSLALIAGKAAIIFLLCRLFGFARGASLHAGLLLSQGGEFAFVLFGFAATLGVVDSTFSQVLLVMITFTMALTPLLDSLGARLAHSGETTRQDPEQIEQETLDLDQHVIIAGFGRMGRTVARFLSVEKVNYIALDLDPMSVSEGRKRGKPIYYGNAGRIDVLQSVGIDRARMFVVAINNLTITRQVIETVRAAYPEMLIIARAPDIDQCHQLEAAGATVAVPETYEASLQLGGAILRAIGTPEPEITRVVDNFRSDAHLNLKPLEA